MRRRSHPRGNELTVSEVMALLHISESSARRFAQRGFLRATNRQRCWYFDAEQFADLPKLQERLKKLRQPQKDAAMLTTAQVARRFGVNRSTVKRWLEKGMLHADWVAGRWLYPKEAINKLTRQQLGRRPPVNGVSHRQLQLRGLLRQVRRMQADLDTIEEFLASQV